MDALEKLMAITAKLQTVTDEKEKARLLNEAKDLVAPAKEEVEISERLLRIETEHDLGLKSED